MDSLDIVDVRVAVVCADLPEPIAFGDWLMKRRDFAVVRVELRSGAEGWSFTLSRDGTVADQIRHTIAPIYLGRSAADPEALFAMAKGRSLASHSAGIGLRALSIVDLAVWDALAVHNGVSHCEPAGRVLGRDACHRGDRISARSAPCRVDPRAGQ